LSLHRAPSEPEKSSPPWRGKGWVYYYLWGVAPYMKERERGGAMGDGEIGCTLQAPLPGGGGGGLIGLLRLRQSADDLPPNPPKGG